MPKAPWITLIAGPTASGKSSLALRLARETGAVIVNADSQQLYADLRILTARPSMAEEAQAEHRLYGVADAAEAWSVGRWSRAAQDVLARLKEEGRPALLVGGTGLYFTALTKGLAEIPPVPVELRNAVDKEFEARGETAFRARLDQADPEAARSIEQGDRQRLIRAMSVFEATGTALSAWRAKTRPLLDSTDWTGLVIEPDRSKLYENCDRRVDAMIAEGALDEVQRLATRDLDPTLPAMKAVGVRELSAVLRGDMEREDAIDALKQATRNYAKRQLTWFRNQTPDWTRHPA